MFTGTIRVKICEACGLRPTDFQKRHNMTFGKPDEQLIDPYVSIDVDENHLGNESRHPHFAPLRNYCIVSVQKVIFSLFQYVTIFFCVNAGVKITRKKFHHFPVTFHLRFFFLWKWKKKLSSNNGGSKFSRIKIFQWNIFIKTFFFRFISIHSYIVLFTLSIWICHVDEKNDRQKNFVFWFDGTYNPFCSRNQNML